MNLRAPEQKIERFFRTVRDQFLVELTEDRAALYRFRTNRGCCDLRFGRRN